MRVMKQVRQRASEWMPILTQVIRNLSTRYDLPLDVPVSFKQLKMVKLSVLCLLIVLKLSGASQKEEKKFHLVDKDWNKLWAALKITGISPQTVLSTTANLNETQCNKDFVKFLEGLLNFKFWALAALDSSTTIISQGFTYGNRILYGDMDNCLAIRAPDGITPQFCMFSIHNNTKIVGDLYMNWARYPMAFAGLCLPTSCAGEYVANIMTGLNSQQFNWKMKSYFNLTINKEDCQTIDSQKEWTALNYITLYLISAIFLLVVLATIMGIVYKNKAGKLTQYLQLASLFRNGEKLFDVDKVKPLIKSINGFRGLLAIYIVWGHTSMYATMGNANSPLNKKNLIMVQNTWVAFTYSIVDIFLFMSGLLTVVAFYIQLQTKKSYDPILMVTTRYIRFLVPIGIIIIYKIGISEHMDNGPIYNLMNNYYRETCPDTAIPTLLSYVNWVTGFPHEMCYQHLWYIAVDIQLFIVSQIVLLSTWWKLRSTAVISLTLGCISAINNFNTANQYNLAPFPSIASNGNNFHHDYTMTHTRATPWLFGMFAGCILAQQAAKPKNISKVIQVILWSVTIGLIVGQSYWIQTFSLKVYTQPSAALYFAATRVTLSFVTGWLIFSINFNISGFLGKLLAWYPLDFIGRISFEIFMIHVAVVEYIQASSRRVNDYDIHNKWQATLLPLTYTIFWATVMNLFVTAPTNSILSAITRNYKILPLRSPIIDDSNKKNGEKSELKTKEE